MNKTGIQFFSRVKNWKHFILICWKFLDNFKFLHYLENHTSHLNIHTKFINTPGDKVILEDIKMSFSNCMKFLFATSHFQENLIMTKIILDFLGNQKRYFFMDDFVKSLKIREVSRYKLLKFIVKHPSHLVNCFECRTKHSTKGML